MHEKEVLPPEALPYVKKLMQQHPVIFLEEAHEQEFSNMLDDRISVEAYVAGLDTEYPEFSRLSCMMYRELHLLIRFIADNFDIAGVAPQ